MKKEKIFKIGKKEIFKIGKKEIFKIGKKEILKIGKKGLKERQIYELDETPAQIMQSELTEF